MTLSGFAATAWVCSRYASVQDVPSRAAGFLKRGFTPTRGTPCSPQPQRRPPADPAAAKRVGPGLLQFGISPWLLRCWRARCPFYPELLYCILKGNKNTNGGVTAGGSGPAAVTRRWGRSRPPSFSVGVCGYRHPPGCWDGGRSSLAHPAPAPALLCGGRPQSPSTSRSSLGL